MKSCVLLVFSLNVEKWDKINKGSFDFTKKTKGAM